MTNRAVQDATAASLSLCSPTAKRTKSSRRQSASTLRISSPSSSPSDLPRSQGEPARRRQRGGGTCAAAGGPGSEVGLGLVVVVAVLVELGLDEQQGFAMQAAASTAAAAAATAGDAIRWVFGLLFFQTRRRNRILLGRCGALTTVSSHPGVCAEGRDGVLLRRGCLALLQRQAPLSLRNDERVLLQAGLAFLAQGLRALWAKSSSPPCPAPGGERQRTAQPRQRRHPITTRGAGPKNAQEPRRPRS